MSLEFSKWRPLKKLCQEWKISLNESILALENHLLIDLERMLSNIYRQHTERLSSLKQKQEKKKKELLSSIDQLTHVVLDRLNDEVSECYKNEKRIDQSCKQLIGQSNLLLKQSQSWIHLIGQFSLALKELGDVENYSKIILRECSTITNTLATVHQDMIVEQQQNRQSEYNHPEECTNLS